MSNSNRSGAGNGGATPPIPPLEQVFRHRRILITGGTGFLGKIFVCLMLRHHPEVERIHLLIRGDKRSSQNRFRREILESPIMKPLRDHIGSRFDRLIEEKVNVVPGDITEEGLLTDGTEPFEKGGLDAVVHSAGLVNFEASLEKAIEINVSGVAHVLEFCRKIGAAMLHVSTCYVAGIADGHRFEDDIPENWCPSGQGTFSLEREIREAREAIARIEAESHDLVNSLALAAKDDAEPTQTVSRGSGFEHRRKQWIEERLKEVGRHRATSWGWPNTYSYTKSLGEQLVLAARGKMSVTVVRPTVIESALVEPLPGWNQGVNTSAPLAYLTNRGYRFYPATSGLVLDVIPVDLVVHAMIAILGALLQKQHKPIYQLGTSDRNPLSMRRLVELTALATREAHGREKATSGGLVARTFEAVVATQRTYDLATRTVPHALKRAVEIAQSVAGSDSEIMRRLAAVVDSFKDNNDFARELMEVYRPFIQQHAYIFHSQNIRDLYKSLSAVDVTRHRFHPESIDWYHYWVGVHMPGLRRYAYPQLDFHTRQRGHSLPRFRNLVDLLGRSADRYGSSDALLAHSPSGLHSSISYNELRDRAHRAGILLALRGVEPADRVLLVSENSPDWVLAFFSILCAGAVPVLLEHNIAASDLPRICEVTRPRALLRSSAVGHRLAGAIATFAAAMIEMDLTELSRPFILDRRIEPPGESEREALAAIAFTSGTTGQPKAVALTHGNFTAQVAMLGRVFAISTEDTLLSLMPLHHTFELVCGMLLPLASGASIVYTPKSDPLNADRGVADIQPTVLFGTPSFWGAIHRQIMDDVESGGPFVAAGFEQFRQFNRRLKQDHGINLGSLAFRSARRALGGKLRMAVNGGAALPHLVSEFFNDIGIDVLECYGLTEAAPVLCTARSDEPFVPGSSGKPLRGVEIRLEPEGAELGEILVRGQNVMASYYHDPSTTEAVTRDGWLHTGDLGRIDSQGRLYIVGRAREVMDDSEGNRLYSDELEEAYGQSPDVKELAVVGLQSPQGVQPAALVVPAYARSEGRRTIEDRLRTHFEKVASKLSPNQRIRVLRFNEVPLPRTSTSKVKRGEAAQILQGMLERIRNPSSVAEAGKVEPWLAEALTQVSGENIEISPALRLVEDLGLDALAMSELAELIDAQTGRWVSRWQLSNVETVADLQRLAAESESSGPSLLPSYTRFAQPFTPRLPGAVKSTGRAALRATARAFFDSWLKPRIVGRGNVPFNRNVLVVANLASHLDFGLISHAMGAMGKDHLVGLAAKDYFFNTAARRFLASNFTSLIPFDRRRAQLESLDDALDQLAAGRNVLMFPEGTRSPDGAVHEFNRGVGYLVLRSGCDVLPVLIRGTRQVLGKGSLFPRRGPVEIRIGSVIPNAELRVLAEDADGIGVYRKIANHLRRVILGLVPRQRTPRRQQGLAAESAIMHSESSLPSPRRSARSKRSGSRG